MVTQIQTKCHYSEIDCPKEIPVCPQCQIYLETINHLDRCLTCGDDKDAWREALHEEHQCPK